MRGPPTPGMRGPMTGLRPRGPPPPHLVPTNMGPTNMKDALQTKSAEGEKIQGSIDDSKRKRTNSGGTIPITPQHLICCQVKITNGIRDSEITVLPNLCALSNSVGGTIIMENIDAQPDKVLNKNFDTWLSGIDDKSVAILSRDDICNHFDLEGNPADPVFNMSVKPAEHLCTLEYNCFLPTDTRVRSVTHNSMLLLLCEGGDPGKLKELPPIPHRFVCDQSAEGLKRETKQIQFKQFTHNSESGTSNLLKRISDNVTKYASAFANYKGGRIYFGIKDKNASVCGEEMSREDQAKLEKLIETKIHNMIWGNPDVKPKRGEHWDIEFFPVENVKEKGSRVMVVVSVVKFPGGVFTHCPDSTFVNPGGRVEKYSFTEWKEAIMKRASRAIQALMGLLCQTAAITVHPEQFCPVSRRMEPFGADDGQINAMPTGGPTDLPTPQLPSSHPTQEIHTGADLKAEAKSYALHPKPSDFKRDGVKPEDKGPINASQPTGGPTNLQTHALLSSHPTQETDTGADQKYTYLMTNQLESQRPYFEEKMNEEERTMLEKPSHDVEEEDEGSLSLIETQAALTRSQGTPHPLALSTTTRPRRAATRAEPEDAPVMLEMSDIIKAIDLERLVQAQEVSHARQPFIEYMSQSLQQLPEAQYQPTVERMTAILREMQPSIPHPLVPAQPPPASVSRRAKGHGALLSKRAF